mgnify:CR=1 FL=1
MTINAGAKGGGSVVLEILYNGQKKPVQEGQTVALLLRDLGANQQMVSVQYNGRVLRKEEYNSTFLQDGDEVKVLYFMGGGQ